MSVKTTGYSISNERLEFLGDAVLSTVVAQFLFKKFPTRQEGFMTEMRSKIVSRASLNKLSQKFGLENLINYAKFYANIVRYTSFCTPLPLRVFPLLR